jgi:hypothetical protein
MNADDLERAVRVAEKIKPLLAGLPPEVQGAVLGQLVAIWSAGHHPSIRDERWRDLVMLIRELTPVEIEIMIEADRVAPEWRGSGGK